MKNRLLLLISTALVIAGNAWSQNPDIGRFNDMEVVNAGKTVNTPYFEGFPMIMPDGLTLYFSSDRPGGEGDLDIYVTWRKSTEDVWSEPINIRSINSPTSDHSVTVSPDGHTMYFMSKREGGYGSGDIYISHREDVSDPAGWGNPKNAGPVINTEKLEACPLVHINGNKTELYFVSSREDRYGLGGIDIYSSNIDEATGQFEIPVNMSDINSTDLDMHFEPVQGLIWSDRPGGPGGQDIWLADLDMADGLWKNPIPLKPPVNTEHVEGMPSITHDLNELIFHSDRPGGEGNLDIYIAKPKQSTNK